MDDVTDDDDRLFDGDSMPEFNMLSYAEIPAFFLQGLTNEQIKGRSQLYRTAYEKARESFARRVADRKWMRENGLTFGEGI